MKTNLKHKWLPPFLTNIFCLIGLLVVVFSITIFTQNERQRELLYRRMRSIGTNQEVRQIREFLPPLIQIGPEFRFQGSNYNIGDCSKIPLDYEKETLIGQGYSKQVFGYGNMAVKRPMLKNGKTFRECVQKVEMNEKKCLDLEIQGFISEIGLILQLQGDPTVPKLFAYCIPLDSKMNELAAVVELGEPVDLIKYINLNWKKRLLFITEILEFLERLRPLKFLDFRRQQFAMRGDQHPMYVDFDSVTVGDNQTDSENTRKVYDTFANKYLWIGHPAGSVKVLSRLRRQFNQNKLKFEDFRQALNELQHSNFK